jgi:hypothetical protein
MEQELKSGIVKLISSDNVMKEVDIDILKKSKLLEDFGEGEVIHLKEVDNKNLELIIKYLEHYKNMEPKEIPKPFPDRTDDEFFRGILNDDWTFDFLKNISLEDTINLTNAANFMQIDGLINILAAKVAHEMCNCEIEEARNKFEIQGDLTEEELAEIDKYPLD